MSKNRNLLIGGGLIALGSITALGLAIIPLTSAIVVGAIAFGAIGAIELANISKNNGDLDQEISGPGKIDWSVDEREKGRIKTAIISKKWLEKERKRNLGREIGRKIGREIAEEHIRNPQSKVDDSEVIKIFEEIYKKQKESIDESLLTIEAKYQMEIARAAKEIAIYYCKYSDYEKESFKSVFKAYENSREFKDNPMAKEAFDTTVKILEEKTRPNSITSKAIGESFKKEWRIL